MKKKARRYTKDKKAVFQFRVEKELLDMAKEKNLFVSEICRQALRRAVGLDG
jgi:hypothetical protein